MTIYTARQVIERTGWTSGRAYKFMKDFGQQVGESNTGRIIEREKAENLIAVIGERDRLNELLNSAKVRR